MLAREYGTEYSNVLTAMNKGWVENVDSVGYMRLAYISELVPKGKVAPLEYCSDNIRDIIISARKQAMISTLEQELLNDARENGQFVIYR